MVACWAALHWMGRTVLVATDYAGPISARDPCSGPRDNTRSLRSAVASHMLLPHRLLSSTLTDCCHQLLSSTALINYSHRLLSSTALTDRSHQLLSSTALIGRSHQLLSSAALIDCSHRLLINCSITLVISAWSANLVARMVLQAQGQAHFICRCGACRQYELGV